MEVPVPQSEVLSRGTLDSVDFGIEHNAYSFKALSSDLYSDAHRAIVRELMCNAYDAHVEAGTQDTPFKVFLPNDVEPTFKVRDYGTGLSHTDVMHLYSRFFASTKKNTNDQIGCFGLGSKSPFAYTKNFTVVSYLNGEKRTYSMVLDQGLPKTVHMATEKTEEKNGLEVFFAVSPSDFITFKAAAKVVARPFFRMKTSAVPEFGGILGFTPLKEAEAVLEGTNWKVLKTSYGHNMPEKCAVMGNVEYPMRSQIGFSPNARLVLTLPIRVDFPIGTFKVTPSRESIKWEDSSKEGVNKVLEEVYDEIIERINAAISTAPTLWEARLKATQFLKEPLSSLRAVPLWHGTKVTRYIKLPKECQVQSLTAALKYDSRTKQERMSCSTDTITRMEAVETEFFLADFPGARHRLGSYVRDQPKGTRVHLLSAPSHRALKSLLRTIGVSFKTLRLASSIPKKVREKKATQSKKSLSRLAGSRARAYSLRVSARGERADRYWNESTVDVKEGGIYVELCRYKAVRPGGVDLSPDYLCRIVKALGDLTGQSPLLVGVKTAKADKFKNSDKWTCLFDYVLDTSIEVWSKDGALRLAYSLLHEMGNTNNFFQNEKDVKFMRSAVECQASLEAAGYVNPDSSMRKFSIICQKLFTKTTVCDGLDRLRPYWRGVFSPVHLGKAPNFTGALIRNYPMLGITVDKDLHYYTSNKHWKGEGTHIREYIKFMDGLKEQGVKW